jgi:predicted secreted hydrolase
MATPAPTGETESRSALRFPEDFGAHPDSRTEWWYVTGILTSNELLWGFQVTFFRSATGLSVANSRFAASELIFAHAALSDPRKRQLLHDQRIARSGFGIAQARTGNTEVGLREWHLGREAVSGDSQRARYRTHIASDSAGFAFELLLDTTQPVLLQGDGGISRKGPSSEQISHYYSEPQLSVQGTLNSDGKAIAVQGRAWLDHEWSDSFIAPQAVGWDWIGMNLDDGGALTAFRLRRSDGTTLYAGGSFRAAGKPVRNFASSEVSFSAGRLWESQASRARYPVQWQLATPVGRFRVSALFDNQELDSRGSTGAIYWEGLSELIDESNTRVGRGYLEMTGYAAPLSI